MVPADDSLKLDRTWLCSIVFSDVVDFSKQSVELQMKWKAFFNKVLGDALGSVPVDGRVVLDTGDGAAICFLGDPETALLATLSLRAAFIDLSTEGLPAPNIRLGIHLGPVKLVRDINGNLNALGDGINVAQRIMSFAEPNQILVSRSFFEVISPLSDDYNRLFRYDGVRQDKHVREHTVYEVHPSGHDNSKLAPVAAIVLPVAAPAPPPPPAKTSNTGLWLGLAAAAAIIGILATVLVTRRPVQESAAAMPAASLPSVVTPPFNPAPAPPPVASTPSPSPKATAAVKPVVVAAPPPSIPSPVVAAAVTGTGVAGKWQYDMKYSWGVELTETMDLKVDGAEVFGTSTYLRTVRGIVDGKLDGNKVTFTTKSQSILGGKTYEEKHVYRGRLVGDTLEFMLQTDSGYDSRSPETFTARRVQ